MSPSNFPENLTYFSDALNVFERQTAHFSQICVAYSGGLDSTVLLHLLSQSPQLKGRLMAHHVNHDLQENASEWVKHCDEFCLNLNIPFQSSKLQWPSVKREGVESVARKLRYQALTKGCCLDTNVLVTGHHQRDQAETLLLNLVRGAGVSGLAAMPSIKVLSTKTGSAQHYRPLLHIPYLKLKAYAEHFHLTWVEDPSNVLTCYRRNAMRQEVLPALSQYWPEVEKTLARTADHMSEAHTLLNRMAKQTLEPITGKAFYFDFEQVVHLDWLEQKNALRYWLLQQFNLTLSARHYKWIKEVLSQQAESRNSAFSYRLKQGELRFYHKRLYCLKNNLLPYLFDVDFSINILGEGQRLALHLHDDVIKTAPFPLMASERYYDWHIEADLVSQVPDMKVRNISKEDDLNRKKLKSFFQKNNIPAWERPYWPVLSFDGVVVAVLGCFSCVKRLGKYDAEQRGGEKKSQPVVLLSVSQHECYRIMTGGKPKSLDRNVKNSVSILGKQLHC